MIHQIPEVPTLRRPGLCSSGALGRFPFPCRSLVAPSLVWLLSGFQLNHGVAALGFEPGSP